MTNKPAQMSKRILAALLDLMMIYFLVVFATWLVSLTPLGTAFNEVNSKYEAMYNSFALKEGYGVWVQNSGSSSLSFMSGSVGSSLFSNFQSAALADSTFVETMKTTKNYYLLINIISVVLVESLYLGLMPILNKKGQTFGKMVMGLGVVDANNDILASRKQKVIRFAMGVGVETVLVMLLFQNNVGMVIFMSPLIVLMTIMISQKKQALHDVVAKTKVVDLHTATIFETVEEKEAYDASLMNDTTSSDEDNIDEEIVEPEVIEEESQEEPTEVIEPEVVQEDTQDDK